jgi:hypothetical protein
VRHDSNMKAEHLKKAADQALKTGNLRVAYTKCVVASLHPADRWVKSFDRTLNPT